MPGKLTIVKADIFGSGREILFHGCNASGAFGRGLAGQVAMRMPRVKRAYHDKFARDGWALGQTQWLDVSGYGYGFKTAVNACTQTHYGSDGRQYASYEAVHECMQTILGNAAESGHGVCGPLLGTGLGGLEVDRVIAIYRDLLRVFDVECDAHVR